MPCRPGGSRRWLSGCRLRGSDTSHAAGPRAGICGRESEEGRGSETRGRTRGEKETRRGEEGSRKRRASKEGEEMRKGRKEREGTATCLRVVHRKASPVCSLGQNLAGGDNLDGRSEEEIRLRPKDLGIDISC